MDCGGNYNILAAAYLLKQHDCCDSIDVNLEGNLNHGGKIEVPVSGNLDVDQTLTLDTASFRQACEDCGQQQVKKPGGKSRNNRRNNNGSGTRIYNNNGNGNQTITEQPAEQPTGQQGGSGSQKVDLQGGNGNGVTIINNNGNGQQSVTGVDGNGVTIINNNGGTGQVSQSEPRKGVPVTTTWTAGYMVLEGRNPCRGRGRVRGS